MNTEMNKYGRVDMHVWYTLNLFADDPIRKEETREIYTYDTLHSTTVHEYGVDRWYNSFMRDERISYMHIMITEPDNSDNVLENYTFSC